MSLKEYFIKSRRIDGDNVYQTCIHPFALLPGYLVVPYSRITPNAITFVSLLFGLAAAACAFLLPIYYSVVLIFIAFVLDTVDGDVARARGTGSLFGKMLDILVDRTVFSLLSLGYIYLFLRTGRLTEASLLIGYVVLYFYICVVGKNILVYWYEAGKISAASASGSSEITEERKISTYFKSFLSIRRWLPTRLGSEVLVFIVAPLTGYYAEMYIAVIVSIFLSELILPYLKPGYVKKLIKSL